MLPGGLGGRDSGRNAQLPKHLAEVLKELAALVVCDVVRNTGPINPRLQ